MSVASTGFLGEKLIWEGNHVVSTDRDIFSFTFSRTTLVLENSQCPCPCAEISVRSPECAPFNGSRIDRWRV